MSARASEGTAAVIAREQRSEPRARVQVRLHLTCPSTGRVHGFRTTNLSVGGATCVGETMLEPGAVHEAVLLLPLSEAGRDVELEVPLKVRVVHGHADVAAGGRGLSFEMGVTFEEIAWQHEDELRGFLYDWMADDRCSPGRGGRGERT